MSLFYVPTYTTAMIRMYPEFLFVFGDNFEGWGKKGQAAVARGEPNAVGIPTKRRPATMDDAFLCNADLVEWQKRSLPAMLKLTAHIQRGGVVIWPLEGIGSGEARLVERAPEIWRAINLYVLSLEKLSKQPVEHRRK